MIYLSDPDVFDKIAIVESGEGPRWAERDRLMVRGEHSMTGLLRAWAEYQAHKDKWGLDRFDADLFGHSGVVYGEGGMSRWIARPDGEIVLDGESTHTRKRLNAEKAGFRVTKSRERP
jgi:hypothetical protein